MVIDPGIGVTGQLDEIIAEHRLHPVAVLLTHGHLDHTFSVLPVCQAHDVPAYIHPGRPVTLADPWARLGLVRRLTDASACRTDLRRTGRRPGR